MPINGLYEAPWVVWETVVSHRIWGGTGSFFKGHLTDHVGFYGHSSGLWSLTSHLVVLFVFNANLAARLEFHGPCSVHVPPYCYSV